MAIELNPVYERLYTTDKRYIFLTGGRGSQKSFTLSTFLCQLTYEEFQQILFTRYTMTSAEISIIPEFKEKTELLEVSDAFYSTSKEITNIYTGNRILFRGIKTSSGVQTANLKSINGISCWVVDEGEEFVDEDAFDTIDLSIRTTKAKNRVIIAMNPPSKDHFMYKRWFENNHRIEIIDGAPIEICTHPDVEHIHTTYLDNLQYLDATFLNRIAQMKQTSLRTYNHKALGQWLDIAEGSLFQHLKTWKPSSTDAFTGSIAYIDVADEGTDYTCMMIGRTIGNLLYIVDIVFTDQNTDVSIPLCAQALKKHNVKYCRVESNSMGGMFKKNLEKQMIGNACVILSASSTTHKHTRILNDSVDICEYFRFIDEIDRSPMYHNAVGQMRSYTKDGKAKHDDSPDAASGLIRFCRTMEMIH